MSAKWGTLLEPTLPAPGEDSPSDIDARADRASPGEWDEDLGHYGSDPWNLPGHGESGPRCGFWYAKSVCDECAHVDLATHSCGRRGCPDCWGIWAREAAVRASTRIQCFRYRSEFKQAAHVVVSPPEADVMTEREFYKGKKKAAEMAQEKGMRGCAVVAHPWRPTDLAKELYRAVDRDVGIWVWLRQEYTEDEIRQLVKWSPHYHIIGATTPDMDPADDSDEWNYVWLRSFKPIGGATDQESHEDVYGAFRYLLSHTGWPEESTKQAITWYGDLANSVFVEEATEDWQIQKPSEGVQNTIQRVTEEVAGVTPDEEEEGDGGGDQSDDDGECPLDDCGGRLIDVFDVDAYLRHNEPPPEVSDTMRLMRDWRLGDIAPPPGMKQPTTEEQAREVVDHLVGA